MARPSLLSTTANFDDALEPGAPASLRPGRSRTPGRLPPSDPHHGPPFPAIATPVVSNPPTQRLSRPCAGLPKAHSAPNRGEARTTAIEHIGIPKQIEVTYFRDSLSGETLRRARYGRRRRPVLPT